MTKRMRTPTLLALLITVMLAGAYLIVVKNGSSGAAGLPPAGVLH